MIARDARCTELPRGATVRLASRTVLQRLLHLCSRLWSERCELAHERRVPGGRGKRATGECEEWSVKSGRATLADASGLGAPLQISFILPHVDERGVQVRREESPEELAVTLRREDEAQRAEGMRSDALVATAARAPLLAGAPQHTPPQQTASVPAANPPSHPPPQRGHTAEQHGQPEPAPTCILSSFLVFLA